MTDPKAETEAAQLETYRVEAYQAQSGQWAWVIHDADGEDYCRGAGYPTEEEAKEALRDALLACGCFLPDDHVGEPPTGHITTANAMELFGLKQGETVEQIVRRMVIDGNGADDGGYDIKE